MSTEDKIAAIRGEVEERAENADWLPDANFIALATNGVVIYGVPLNESEILALRSAVAREHPDYYDQSKPDHGELLKAGQCWMGPSLAAIWEMLERGKK